MTTMKHLTLAATLLSGLLVGSACDRTFTVYVEEGGEVLATWDGETCTFWHEDGETLDDCPSGLTTFEEGDVMATFEAIPETDRGYSFGAWDGCEDDGTVSAAYFDLEDTLCTVSMGTVGMTTDERRWALSSAEDDDDAYITARFDALSVVATTIQPDYN